MLESAMAGIFGLLGLVLVIYVVFNMPGLLLILAAPLVALIFWQL